MARKQIDSRELVDFHVKHAVFDMTHGKCAHCGKTLDFRKNFTVDHVIPLSKGGQNDIANYAPLCAACNKAKSNFVYNPRDYYPYLPKPALDKLVVLFNKYMASTDWLAYDNLFPVDRFDILSKVAVTNPHSRKPVILPFNLVVQRTDNDTAFEWLQKYTARLKTEDKHVMAATPDDLGTPHYFITNGSKTLCLCSAYVMPQQYHDDDSKPADNTIILNFFTNPELKFTKNITENVLYAAMSGIMQSIYDTLMCESDGGVIMRCIIQFPASDPYFEKAIEIARQQPGVKPYKLNTYTNGQPDESVKSYFNLITLVQYNNQTAKIKYRKLVDKLNQIQQEQGFEAMYDALAEMEKPINARLNHTKPFRKSEKLIQQERRSRINDEMKARRKAKKVGYRQKKRPNLKNHRHRPEQTPFEPDDDETEHET